MYNPVSCLAVTVSTERRTEHCGCPSVLVETAKSTEQPEGATAFFVHKHKTMTKREPKTNRRYGIPVGYIGTAGVQALLNKSRATIWRMVMDGRLPQPLRDGCIKIWDEKELKRWINNAKFCK
jgi:predicted DNA-binding transcriptional regulator AlpA